MYKNFDLHYVPSVMIGALPRNLSSNEQLMPDDEEGKEIGILLAVKALVQLICNPIVGHLSNLFGHKIFILLGTVFLFSSSTSEFGF